MNEKPFLNFNNNTQKKLFSLKMNLIKSVISHMTFSQLFWKNSNGVMYFSPGLLTQSLSHHRIMFPTRMNIQRKQIIKISKTNSKQDKLVDAPILRQGHFYLLEGLPHMHQAHISSSMPSDPR